MLYISRIDHLKSKGQNPDMEGKVLLTVVPWLEMPLDMVNVSEEGERPHFNVDDRIQEFENMADPRLFKLHVLYDEIPLPEPETSDKPHSRGKVIVIYRDPRDVPYSFYMHMCGMNFGKGENNVMPLFSNGKTPTFEEFFDDWLPDNYYMKHLNSFWPHRNDEDVLWLRYEEMSKGPRHSADQIISFLGWDLSSEEIDKAVQLASFDTMKTAERSNTMRGHMFKKDMSFVREGKVGKNREKLTGDMEERLVKVFRDGLDSEAFQFVFGETS